MVMTAAFLAGRLEQFMVSAGPTGAEDPPLGWPDGVSPSPEPFTFVMPPPNTSSKRAIRLTGIVLPSPAASYSSGYASAPPYWQGVRIVGVSGTLMVVAADAANPAGPQTAVITATYDKQEVFTLPGSPAVELVQKIRRISDNAVITFEEAISDLENGVVGVNEPAVPGRILDGDQIEITYLLPSIGPPAAGTVVTVIPRKLPTPAPLPVGTAWAGAYRAFIEQGMAAGVPPAPGSLAAPEAAMKAMLDGMMASPGMGAIALQAGVAAFWAAALTAAPTIFPTALSLVPPPTIATMSAAILATAAANLALTPSDPWTPAAAQAAALNLATAVFSTSAGGLVIFPGPAASPFV